MYKKIIIIIFISIIAVGGLISAILPLFNTGLVVNLKQEADIIMVDETPINDPKFIKLKPGKHKIVAGKLGYKKLEKEVMIKRYGKTKVELIFKDKIKPLLENLPYYDPFSNDFFIEGSYNIFKEPEYKISTFNNDKETPAKWLESKGVNIKGTNIIYIQRGEKEEDD